MGGVACVLQPWNETFNPTLTAILLGYFGAILCGVTMSTDTFIVHHYTYLQKLENQYVVVFLVLSHRGNLISNRKPCTGGANIHFKLEGLDSDFSALHYILHYYATILLYLYNDSGDYYIAYRQHEYHLDGCGTVHGALEYTERKSQLVRTSRGRNRLN